MFIANLPSFRVDGLVQTRKRRIAAAEHIALLGRGRQALTVVARMLGIGQNTEVLLPASLCAEAVWPFLLAGAGVRYYRLDRSLRPDVEDVRSKFNRKVCAAYAVHYYGMKTDLQRLRAECDARGVALIEDCALCLFDGEENGGVGICGDVAVFSPWKMLGMPDGGVLIGNRGRGLGNVRLARSSPTVALRFFAAAALHGARQLAPQLWVASPGQSAHSGPADGTPRAMSRLAHWILERTDLRQVRDSRVANYRALVECVERLGIARPLFPSLPTGSVPYSLPIEVESAIDTQARLRAAGVSSEVSLSLPLRDHPGVRNADERFDVIEALAPRVLSLPIHQSVGPAQRALIAAALDSLR